MLRLDGLVRLQGAQGDLAALAVGRPHHHERGVGPRLGRALGVGRRVFAVGVPVTEARDHHGEHSRRLADGQP